MANNVAVFTWPAASATAVTQLQTLAGAGSLVINGSLTQLPSNSHTASFGDVSRTVSITSTNDLSAVHFVVTGTLNGAVVSEDHVGPNNTTVYTTQLFDTVTSVTAGAAAAAVSIGSGTTGQTQWYQYDSYRPYAAMSVQVVVTATINYSFQTTLDDVTTVATPTVNTGLVVPLAAGVASGDYQLVMSSATATAFASFSYPVRYCNVIINSSTTGSLISSVSRGLGSETT